MKRISILFFLALGLSLSLTAQKLEAPAQVEEAVEAPTDGPQMNFEETTVSSILPTMATLLL